MEQNTEEINEDIIRSVKLYISNLHKAIICQTKPMEH